jgi:octaprenyl-diphosphate synthase
MDGMNLDDFYFEDSYIKGKMSDVDLSGLTGGKYLRSRLLYLAGELFNTAEEDRIKLGRVVELVHNATLTHDDVIDNSHTRRGAPSVPALVNNKKSVLLGDYMLARALHELSDFNNPKLTQELTLTLKELVEGEWIQYENTNPYEITTTLYETLALKKTGSLFRWCFLAPLVASNPDSEYYDLLSEFGEKLGVIFQMTDDLIDFNTESKKSYGLDFRNNNINFVLHFVGMNYPECGTKFLRAEEISDLSADEMKIIEDSLKLAQETVQTYLERCHVILKTLKEKLDLGDDQTPQLNAISEFSSILDLITDRVF